MTNSHSLLLLFTDHELSEACEWLSHIESLYHNTNFAAAQSYIKTILPRPAGCLPSEAFKKSTDPLVPTMIQKMLPYLCSRGLSRLSEKAVWVIDNLKFAVGPASVRPKKGGFLREGVNGADGTMSWMVA